MEFVRKHLGYLFLLGGLGFFIHVFNLHNSLFWDDTDWILNNPSLHTLSWENIKFIFTHDALAGIGQVSNYYRPLLFVSFLLNYVVSGSSPVLYHLVNNLIHIANGLAIFYLLHRWLNRRVAFLATLLFIIHPLQTEAFTYVAGRGDPMSIFFILMGILGFLHFKEKSSWMAYCTAGLAMTLAVLTRETAVLFPAYLGVVLIAFHYQGNITPRFKKAFLDILPFTAITGVYVILRLTVLNFQNTLNFYSQPNLYSENMLYRLYTFFHALLVYIHLMMWPMGLHMERDLPISMSLWQGWAWLGLLLMLGFLSWLIYLYRVGGKAFNVWFFGLGIFFVNLIPTSGVIAINARIYEHWLYFSLFGAFALSAWYIDRILGYIEKKKPRAKPAMVIILIGYCAFLSIQTIRRNIIWGDTERFYLDILHYEPENVRVLNNLGNWHSERDQDSKAAEFYVRAAEADPSQPAPYYNLGNIARDRGQVDQAEELYKQAIAVRPDFHYAYRNLAGLYVQTNRLSEALAILEELQKIYPSAENLRNIDILKKALSKRS